MRVLFTCYPSHAHLWPVVPLAWAMQSAGHEVRVASHARFVDSIRATGLTPVALGEPDWEEARMRPDAKAPDKPEEVLRYAEILGFDDAEREHWIAYFQWLLNPISDYVRTDLPYADELVSFAKAWQPDLMIWDPTFACAPVAARVSGAAHARMLIGSDYLAFSLDRLEAHADELRAAGLSPNPHADFVRPLAEKYGLDVDKELIYGQWSMDPMPPGLTLPTSAIKVPMRYIPFNGAETVPKWLLERPARPRVALTLGESTRRFIKGDWGRTPKILEAVDGLDIEVVATLNAQQLEGVDAIPANVKAIEWVTLNHLIPTCDVMIHHGGIGTYAAAVPLKTRQIVCDTKESLMMRAVEVDPRTMADGTYRIGFEFGVNEETIETVTTWELPNKKLEATPVADYIVSRNAGARLDHTELSVDEIRKLILDVVHNPAYGEGAQDVHDEWLAQPSPAEVVPLLERMTRERRR